MANTAITNLMALLPIKEATDGMFAEAPEYIANMKADIETIDALCVETGDEALVTAFRDYAEALQPIMDTLLQTFYHNAQNLESTMSDMSEGVNNITTAVNESAIGITSSAENTAQLVSSLLNIKEKAHTNKRISDLLSHEVSHFKNM